MIPKFHIFGSERSGTTLLAALLSEHPDVFVLNDSFIYQLFAQVWLKLNPGNLPRVDDTVPDAISTEYMKALVGRYNVPNPNPDKPSWQRQYAELLGSQVETIVRKFHGRQTSVGQMLDMIYAALIPPEQAQKGLLGEKSPIHTFYFPWIRQLNPDAAVVAVVRHPVPNVAAIYKRIDGKVPIDGKLQSGRAALEAAINMYRKYHHPDLAGLYDPAASLVVRYEDLLRSPETVLTAIYQHLGAGEGEIKTEFNYYIKQYYVGTNIDPERDRVLWEFLPADDQELVNSSCADIIAKFYADI